MNVEQAIAATKTALLESGYSLLPSGDTWLEEWWNGDGRGGPRSAILASENGEAELEGLCQKVVECSSVLSAMAGEEYLMNTGKEEGLSAITLRHFSAWLSELSLTPLCDI